jgi:outer membrane protein
MVKKGLLGFLGILFAWVFLFAPNAYAAGKMAYVDLSSTFDKYEKTKVFDEQLAGVQAAKEKEIETIASDIKSLDDKMALLSEKEKAAKQKELDEKKNKLQQMTQEITLDLRKDRDEKLKEILQDIEKVVQTYAQKNGYDFIFNDRVLLYGAASADVTQDVIDALNAGYKPEAKKAEGKK